jgi:GNAT superfamily N-acetyltransferase
MEITYSESRDIPAKQIIDLYKAVGWSAADKPIELNQALQASHSLISAWNNRDVVGVGNAISDGFLVVYYPHLLVHPDFQRKGIGTEIARRLLERYTGFHQQVLIADGKAIDFYRKLGFEPAGETKALWIYRGNEH